MMNNIINIKSSVDNRVPQSFIQKIKSKKLHHQSMMFKTVSPHSNNTTGMLGTTSPTTDGTILNNEGDQYSSPLVMATSSPQQRVD